MVTIHNDKRNDYATRENRQKDYSFPGRVIFDAAPIMARPVSCAQVAFGRPAGRARRTAAAHRFTASPRRGILPRQLQEKGTAAAVLR